MSSCMECEYGSSKGNVYVVCRYFNKVINTKNFSGCPSYKSKRIKGKLTKGKLLEK